MAILRKRSVAILAIALVGCSTTTRLRAPTPDLLSESREGSIVIGRVDGSELGGIPVVPVEFFDRLQPLTLTVRNDSTRKTYDIICDEQGGNAAHFYVLLPPGRYSVAKIRKGDGYVTQQTGRVPPVFERGLSGRGRLSRGDPEGRQPTFEVGPASAGAPAGVTYVGTLQISLVTEEHEIATPTGIMKIPYRRGWSVRDEYEEMVKTFSARYPQATRWISKSLMTD